MPTKEEIKRARKAVEDKMRNIDFQVDTVSVERAHGLGAYFSYDRNSITVNYVSGDDKHNEWAEGEDVAIHEQKHRDNYSQGMHAYAVSPEQAYKRSMHDEISANIASLIALRQKYIETGDISIFDKEGQGRFAFYKEAIEKGEINTNSPYQEDFDKEMRLIVNGTQKMWMDHFAHRSYIKQNTSSMLYYGDFEGKYAEYWDENYQNSLKIAYNIGGVDFTKYMDKDVEIPKEVNTNTKMMEEIVNNPAMQEYYHLTDAQVFEKSGLPPYDGSVSLSEYKKLLQHQMTVNSFAAGRSWVNEETGECKTYSNEEYLKSLNSQETIDKYKEMYKEMTSPEVANADEMKKEYPTFESFLKDMYSIDRQEYQEKFKETANKEAFINKIVEYQAAEYAKTGKKFPQEDNEENYKKAVNKIYCGSYDVLQPDENKLKGNLSDKTKHIMNGESWLEKLRDKAQSFKHRLTYINDENGKEQNVGLWGKIKHKSKQIKEDLTTEIEYFNGQGWISKCSVWKGIKNKTSSWLNNTWENTKNRVSSLLIGGDKKDDVAKKVKNEPTHTVNAQKPEYPKWSEDKRVSDVQHRQILDMREPIIKQPTKSKTDTQSNDMSSKNATLSKMKSDAGKGKTLANPSNSQVAAANGGNKSALKNTMNKDAQNAKIIYQNIGKQQTTQTQNKATEFAHKGTIQMQMFGGLYHKVME